MKNIISIKFNTVNSIDELYKRVKKEMPKYKWSKYDSEYDDLYIIGINTNGVKIKIVNYVKYFSSIYESTVLDGHMGVQSKLGLATENITYTRGDVTIQKDKAMFGGGSQTTLALKKMSEIKILW